MRVSLNQNPDAYSGVPVMPTIAIRQMVAFAFFYCPES